MEKDTGKIEDTDAYKKAKRKVINQHLGHGVDMGEPDGDRTTNVFHLICEICKERNFFSKKPHPVIACLKCGSEYEWQDFGYIVKLSSSQKQLLNKQTLPLMRFFPESSNIYGVGYFNGDLYIMFKNINVYRYDNIPIALYWDLMSADSKGGFFYHAIKKHYKGIPITEGIPEYMNLMNERPELKNPNIQEMYLGRPYNKVGMLIFNNFIFEYFKGNDTDQSIVAEAPFIEYWDTLNNKIVGFIQHNVDVDSTKPYDPMLNKYYIQKD